MSERQDEHDAAASRPTGHTGTGEDGSTYEVAGEPRPIPAPRPAPPASSPRAPASPQLNAAEYDALDNGADTDEPTGPTPVRMIVSLLVLLPLRLVVGGLFVMAGFLKISNPQEFANSIKAFKIVDPESSALAEQFVIRSAFVLPWLEITLGLLLILGLKTRSAALVLAGMIGVFMAAIWSVIDRGLNVTCGCFGEYERPCTGAIGACHMWRNGGLLSAALVLLIFGAGVCSLDALDRWAANRRLRRALGR